ncbi:response regulator transcription factor [Streptomyces sp. ISL-22]|uniref:response regulator n=1 Tax=unclassified Streptomyces TaxID=2593676 RepID=UPI001BE9977D|nr:MULTISPECIES: response regulator transcription factor [unclassified Streptomyces]MBT2417950.1 response regulator transcription factor [Streptomyces sp. ISL-24]MBT2432375.1 response regulator transcription factor [Streptomyces sp. ISL-22]
MNKSQPPSPTAPLRIVVADDNPVVRAGLTALLSTHADIRVVAEATNGHEAQEAARRHRPDVILLDVRMPGMDGIEALPHLVRTAPVMMLTYSGESETVREALRRGAAGYLIHGEFTADELVEAVRDIKRGRSRLTPTAAAALAQANAESSTAAGNLAERLSQVQPGVGQSSSYRSRFQLSRREAEIMDLIASGMNNQQIAATCFISEKTVKNHINRIFAKLHSTSRAEAAAKWLGTAPGYPQDRGDRR